LPRPVAARARRGALDGQTLNRASAREVAQIAAEEVEPPDDFHASAEYRRSLVAALLEDALLEAAARGGRA
jgi:aerobic carbon-monoxide dehydrogenase medium subunit